MKCEETFASELLENSKEMLFVNLFVDPEQMIVWN